MPPFSTVLPETRSQVLRSPLTGNWLLRPKGRIPTFREDRFSGTIGQRPPPLPNCGNGFAPSEGARGYASILASLESWWLLVQDNTQEGGVDVQTAIVSNEA